MRPTRARVPRMGRVVWKGKKSLKLPAYIFYFYFLLATAGFWGSSLAVGPSVLFYGCPLDCARTQPSWSWRGASQKASPESISFAVTFGQSPTILDQKKSNNWPTNSLCERSLAAREPCRSEDLTVPKRVCDHANRHVQETARVRSEGCARGRRPCVPVAKKTRRACAGAGGCWHRPPVSDSGARVALVVAPFAFPS